MRWATPCPLFSRENLLETMETWLADNAVMKRTFKGSAIIAGLIDRAMPGGKRKTGRQAAFSTDILYDTLRKYDPDHVMLEITRAEAMRGLVDFGRIEEMLERDRRPDRPCAPDPRHAAGRAAVPRTGARAGRRARQPAADGGRGRPPDAHGGASKRA
jgi:hypothetical protein